MLDVKGQLVFNPADATLRGTKLKLEEKDGKPSATGTILPSGSPGGPM